MELAEIGSSISGAQAYLNMRPIYVVIFVTDLLISKWNKQNYLMCIPNVVCSRDDEAKYNQY